MDLKYLEEYILPVREKEIKDGKHLYTRNPIYVVYDLHTLYVSGHSEITICPNNISKHSRHGYFDDALEYEDMEFSTSLDGMENPWEVTELYYSKFVAVFLTSEAAHDFLEYQKHNYPNGYVYVECAGGNNKQMNRLLENN